MNIPKFFHILSLLLISGFPVFADQQAPKIPDLKTLFKKDTLLFKATEHGLPSYYFATDNDFETFKKKLITVLGESWKELPPIKVKHQLPPGVKDPFASQEKEKAPKIPKRAILETGKKVKWHLQLVISETPVKGKKHVAEISMWKVKPPK